MKNRIIPALLDPESTHERAFCISMSCFKMKSLMLAGCQALTHAPPLISEATLRGAFHAYLFKIPSVSLFSAALFDVYLFSCYRF